MLRYTRGLDRDQFIHNEVIFDAVVRNLGILGEAARQVSPGLRRRYPQIPWRKIVGLRNVVTHLYFGLDEDILWDIIQHSVPALLAQLRQMLEAEFRDDQTK